MAVVCRRLMTVPGVGPLVAVTYKSAMDDPNRIMKSKAAGALFGLTPKKGTYRSLRSSNRQPWRPSAGTISIIHVGSGAISVRQWPRRLGYRLYRRPIEEERRMQVLVRDNNVDQALKVLKKKMQREGVFRETKLPLFRGGCRLPKAS
jgi:hypothetical protein